MAGNTATDARDPTDAADTTIPARMAAGETVPCAQCGADSDRYADTGGGFVYALHQGCEAAFFGEV